MRRPQHHFRLKPPLPEEKVERFEAEHGVRLPEDYRAFLRLAGNGGAGPGAGLRPLRSWDGVFVGRDPARLARRSPLRPNYPTTDFELTPLFESFRIRLFEIGPNSEVLPPDDDPYRGTITLADLAGNRCALLVVSGEFRGRIAYVRNDNRDIPYFVRHDDFLSWYERWLDELGQDLRDGDFGYGPPGGEAELATILRTGNDMVLRTEAYRALSRFNSLKGQSRAELRLCLHDPAPRVRSAVCELLGSLRRDRYPPSAESVADAAAIAPLIADDDPSVRIAALRSLQYLRFGDWQPAARRLLQDGSAEVVGAALELLGKERCLLPEEFARFVARPEKAIRLGALQGVEWARQPSFEVPSEVLTDPDIDVRLAAWRVHHRDRPGELERLEEAVRHETDPRTIIRLLEYIASAGGLAYAARRVTTALIEGTRHADPRVRGRAADLLGERGGMESLPALQRLLSDTTPFDFARTVGEAAAAAAARVRKRAAAEG